MDRSTNSGGIQYMCQAKPQRPLGKKGSSAEGTTLAQPASTHLVQRRDVLVSRLSVRNDGSTEPRCPISSKVQVVLNGHKII